ncbi:MAG: hypothetical protein GEU89_05650 [Kiloniellaceae bacterium]|nr:hypothetical protein [Kiloniellaceae bacterium]
MSRIALEGADGKLSGGVPAVPLPAMERARSGVVHPMTDEAMTTPNLDDVQGRPPVAVDKGRGRRRRTPGGGALRGQRKGDPCKYENHDRCSRSGATHRYLLQSGLTLVELRPGIIAQRAMALQLSSRRLVAFAAARN